jgi:PBP1b-binding outer membrane lipoprotein LpoB
MKLKTVAAIPLLAFTLGACAAAEEPDSFSEQGKTTEQVAEASSSEKAEKKKNSTS